MPIKAEQKVSGEQEAVKNSVCAMCSNYCPTRVHVNQGKATKIELVNTNACPKWKTQLDFVYHPDRLKQPLKRTGERGSGSFAPISWDEALDTVADKLQSIKAKYGPESVAFWIAYIKEPRPYFHRLTHAFGSPNYCTESSNCSSSTLLAATLNYGRDYIQLTKQSTPIEPETKCKLLWSSSIVNSQPTTWKAHLQARQRGLKLIVVDPRRTKIASMADIHLQLRPGTDGALALGMMNVIINQELYDKEFVEKWTEGFTKLKRLVYLYPPEKVEQITWIPSAKIREAAILYATQKPAKIGLSSCATTHNTNGVQNHRAITLLPALTGNIDIPGGNRPPAGQAPTNKITLHERVNEMPPGVGAQKFPLWTSFHEEMQANMLAEQILTGKPYPIKAIYSVGLNLMYFPNSTRFVESLKKLDFIVVNEYFHTPTTPLADIILPVASWLEREILVTQSGGSVTLIEPAIAPVGESWPEWKIFSELAKRMGFGKEFWDGDFDQCINYILKPSGMTASQLRQNPDGITYPVAPQSVKNYERTKFKTASGKVEITSSILVQYGYEPLPVYKEPAESPVSQPELARSFPLVLTTGARQAAFLGSQYRNVPRLRKLSPEALIEINPADAEPRGIKSGDWVKVSSPRGSIKLRANVTDIILAGVVMVPHQWPGEANVNILASDQNLDPISGFASHKAQLCQVTKC